MVDLAAALNLVLEQYQVWWAVVPALEVEEDQDQYSSRIEHCPALPLHWDCHPEEGEEEGWCLYLCWEGQGY